MTGRSVVRAALVTSVVLLSLGGCKVTDRQQEPPASTKVDEVLASGKGRFDLTGPPTREEAGLPAGRTDVTYQRRDNKPLLVQVALPDGKQLDLEARLLTFDALSEPDPTTAPPTSMDLHYYAPTLEAGRDHLLAAAETFDLDATFVTKWYEEAKAPRPNQAPPRAETPWLHSTVGYLRLDVQGRYLPPSDVSDSGQTVIHYLLTWKPAPTARPS